MVTAHPLRPTALRLIGEEVLSPVDRERKIEAAAHLQLQQAPYRELHHVTCDYHEGILTLRGRVSSFYMKQVAQTVVRCLNGVDRLLNRVEVVRKPE
ncbi:MAG: BON domain-containing protein [Pirellulaceae bacterium]